MKSGTIISHYKILEKLGKGGMGVVYKAHDSSLDRTVALKFLPEEANLSEQESQRFEREAQAAARLNHPNICTIHSFDEHEGQAFLVMEYVEGSTLRELIRNGPLPVDRALDYAVQIAKALAKAHDAGIIHRDIKPDNIMVNSEDQIKVMDFGLARLKDTEPITSTVSTLGTVAYMAPEQIQGLKVDHRADLFSFGMVLYEMFTGKHPFPGEHKQAIAYMLVNEDPAPPESLRPEIPPGVANILSRCLEKDPEQRYSAAKEIVHSLQSKELKSIKSASVFSRYSPASAVWAAATAVVVLIIALMLFSPGSLPWGEQALSEVEQSLPGEKHIVVLPFSNLSEETVPSSLNEGIMEMMTSKITRMEPKGDSFWVVPSSEVRYQGITSATEASSIFGTNLAFTGTIQSIDGLFRMTINLVDVSIMRQLKSTVVELDLGDLALLQPELIKILSDMLDVELTPDETRILLAGGSDDADAYRLYMEGRGHLNRYEDIDQVQKAIELFEAAIDLDAGYVRAYAGLGEAYWRKYDLTGVTQWVDNAIEFGEAALELDEQLMEANLAMAFLHNRMGRYEEAMQLLERLPEADRNQPGVLREWARSYEGLGQVELAEQIYLQAIEEHETFWVGYNMLGIFYSNRGLYEQAVEAFTKVTELAPGNHRGFANLGGIYISLQDFDKARQMLERSLELKPNDQALSNLGSLHYLQGDFAEAIRYYEKAVELGNKDYIIWGNLGGAYYWSGEGPEKVNPALQQAIELAEQERQVTPSNLQLLTRLAGYHALLGQQEQAHSLLERATTEEIADPMTLATISHTYEQLGDREEALYWLEKVFDRGVQPEMLELIPGMHDLLDAYRIQINPDS